MKRIPPAVTYTILRLLTFFVPLAILLLLGFNEWFSAIIAALIGFAISLVFLRRSREQVATAIYRKRTGADEHTHDGSSDEDVEDDIVEHAEPIPGEDESMDAAAAGAPATEVATEPARADAATDAAGEDAATEPSATPEDAAEPSAPPEHANADAAPANTAASGTPETAQGTSDSAEADLIGDADTSAGETARAAAERDTDSK